MLIVGILNLRLGGGGTGPPGDPAKESELDEDVAGTPSQAITAGKPPPEAEVSGEDDDVDVVCDDDDDYHFGERPKLEGETKNMSA